MKKQSKKVTKKKKPKVYATLHFDLTDFDAREKYDMCNKAQDMHIILYNIAVLLRNYRKYVTFPTDAEHKLVVKIEEQFYDICKQYDIDPM